MTEIKIIKQQEVLGKNFTIYGSVEEPLFLAKNVAEWIDYDVEQVGKMLKTVDEDEKIQINTRNIITGKGNPLKWFLTEDGLYEVLMQSRKPIAKAFKKEVKQILKEVRTKGAYMTDTFMDKVLEDPDTIIKLIEQVKEERAKGRELEKTIQEQTPKVEYMDSVLASEGLMTTTEIAKDFGMSGVRLNKILSASKVIYKRGGKWYLYSEYEDMGLTKVHVYAPNEDNVSHTLTKWTQRGYKFIVDKLRELGHEFSTVRDFEDEGKD